MRIAEWMGEAEWNYPQPDPEKGNIKVDRERFTGGYSERPGGKARSTKGLDERGMEK